MKNLAQQKFQQSSPPHALHLGKTFPLSANKLLNLALFGCEDCPDLSLSANTYDFDGGVTDFKLGIPHSNTTTKWTYYHQKKQFTFQGWDNNSGSKRVNPYPGLTKHLFANRIALAHALGAHTMTSGFGNVGAYFFARSGFLPQNPDKILGDIKDRTAELTTLGHITPKQSAHIFDIVQKGQNDPKTLWQITDLSDPIIGHPLGFILTYRQYWEGIFDLKNPDQISRARNYTGPTHFDSVMTCAKNTANTKTYPNKPKLIT